MSKDMKIATVKFNMAYDFVCELYNLTIVLVQTSPTTPQDLSKLRVRYVDLKRMREQFDTNFALLVAASQPEEQRETIESRYTEFYEKYYSIQSICSDLGVSDSITTKAPVTQDVGSKSGCESNRFHLPKITLTHFKGIHTEWPNFKSIFDSLIHQNNEISAIQKFHYLLSVLEQEPLNLIKHLSITSENYGVAYNLLQERYENKRLIADKHLDLLLSVSCPNLKNLKRFINTLKENTQALNTLGFDVNSWSFLLYHIVSKKLPLDLRTKFEFTLQPNEIPHFNNLLSFLEQNLKVLEVTNFTYINNNPKTLVPHTSTLHATNLTCYYCSGEHAIYQCLEFDKLKDKKSYLTEKKLCYNCLRPHYISQCLSKRCCQVCKKRHHTKLHNEFQSADSTVNPEPSSPRQVLLNMEPLSTGLLGTALVGVQDVDGQVHVVRAVVDPGAQSCLITESLAQQLRLRRRKSCDLFGVGEHRQATYGKVDCSILSLTDDSVPGLSTEAIVLKRITGYQPAAMVNPIVPEKCSDLQLADKTFNIPGKIDLLLGVNLFSDIFCGPKLKLGNGLPTAHSTIFGWVIMGSTPVTTTQYQHISLLTDESRLQLTISKFWESEESPLPPIPDPEDIICEKHFVNTHSRDPDGRFVVRLPFKVESSQLGDTRLVALKRFHNLERKLMKEPTLRELYIQFMQDYVESGHMKLVEPRDNARRYYIPHHGVLKESSSTTKLRAVFDASLPSTTGVSLNQILLSGPKLQQNIQDIILRFRTYLFVFTCDIKQMYRMVKVHDDDQRFQTIFWRESQDLPLQEFELTTVTYGVTSSAYQAIRVIHELANLNDSTYTEAARVLREDTFVDDIVSGCDTLESAKTLQHQVIDVLAQGRFHLRKWSSNSDELLKGLPADHCETPYRFEDSGDNIFKILGIEWNPSSDNFLYHVSNMSVTLTKRGVLSNIARLYDPCGFITPVTFFAKSLMQRLWLLELGWDDALPLDVQQTWLKFVDDFKSLNQIRIPRHVMGDPHSQYQFHGFSDASERGYAACVYIRCENGDNVQVHLLIAKSRVASVKQKQTIPKLELCGAVLLARLMAHVYKVLHSKLKSIPITAWCDSSIVLTWLRTSPHKLQTFEGNRVSQVQGTIPNATWRHVPSHLNPADCASRGLLPRELVAQSLWWSPSWLKSDPSSWPSTCQLLDPIDLPGVKVSPVVAHVVQTVDTILHTDSTFISTPTVAAHVVQTVETEPDKHSTLAVTTPSDEVVQHVIVEYSSLSQVTRTLGWWLRYLHNVRSPKDKRVGNLTIFELKSALLTCIKSVQSSAFADTIKLLRKRKPIKGGLRRLHPFLDDLGFLRVGGRLVNSDLPFDSKHQFLLPQSHPFTNLLIDHYHQLYGHPGPATLMAILLRRYWIVSARRVVRHRIFQCQRCYRLKAKPVNPFMGNLPADRVTQARPFQRVGLDFAGAFSIKDSHARKPKIFKAYLCVFICFATKAMHLEVVSSLSTDAFLACLDRFVSRRGLPSDIYSDCGTNFLGARNYLKDIYLLKTQIDREADKIQSHLAPHEIQWHLNVPSGPHLGGLWESAVKSSKTLLKRIIGERVLTFEELSTVFCKIESILNSRPICPISSDPSDLETLTPGHFLIGQPLLALPEHDLDQVVAHRLNRWQLLQQITQHFWKRWHSEYLHTLQQRDRWFKPERNLQTGDLVLVMEPNTPPLLWKRARITKLYPGNDGIVRVVDIKTAKGVLKRPVVKLCRLIPEN